ncbi:MAG: hypothetical protein GY757_40980 [bacterium]|nr:hypothetical protein [bacterium]
MNRVIFLVLVVLVVFGFTFADSVEDRTAGEGYFRHLSVESGISGNRIAAMIQDKSGFIWIGTDNGLNKYNGISSTVYPRISGAPGELSSKFLSCILEDHEGVLWVGTKIKGLNRYNRGQDNFTTYLHDPGRPGSINNDYITTLFEDTSGQLWVGTIAGLNKFDRETQTFTSYKAPKEKNTPKNAARITKIYQDQGGDIWVATPAGLKKFDPEKGTFTSYINIPEEIREAPDFVVLRARVNFIFDILEDAPGRLAIATMRGLHTFDTKTETFSPYRVNEQKQDIINRGIIRTLCLDRAGQLWVGTVGNGVCVIKPGTGAMTVYRNDDSKIGSISSNKTMSILEDRTGVIWVGTIGKGINIYNPRKEKFVTFKGEPGDNTSTKNATYAMAQSGTGKIWIANDSGLSAFDRKKGTFTFYEPDHRAPVENKASGMSSGMIRALYEDRAGMLWLGTWGGGLNKYDPQKKEYTWYLNEPGNPESIGGNVVFSIYEDRAGELWVGTRQGGLNRLDREKEKFYRYQKDPKNPKSISTNTVPVIFEDRDGELWVGTNMGGLNKFNRESGEFISYQHEEGNPHSISDNDIISIRQGRDGALWVGTWGGGLNRFDKKSETFTRYSTANGMPNNVVYGILEDRNGHLWMNTDKGVTRFDPKTSIFNNYGPEDGLQGYGFHFGSYLKTTEGEIYFGGPDGFNAFYPEEITNNPNKPAVYITGFTLFHNQEEAGESLFEKNISETPAIELSYKQNIFTLQFAALDYTAPGRNQYKCWMEGLHDGWLYMGNKNSIDFAGLEPGHYIFWVKGTNNDGLWNKEAASLRITITPPFWKTVWFRLLLLICALGIAVTWHRLRIQSLTLELKSETEMNRFFTKYKISAREQEIVRLLLKGKSNKEIEDELFISLPTVKSHIYKVYRKTGVNKRLELINFIQKGTKGS